MRLRWLCEDSESDRERVWAKVSNGIQMRGRSRPFLNMNLAHSLKSDSHSRGSAFPL